MRFVLSSVPRRSAVLAAVNVAMAALLAVSLWQGTQSKALLATPARSIPVPRYPNTRPTDISHFPVIQDRILLYASRHSFAPPANAATPPKPEYRLVGTFIIPSKPAIALLSNASGTSRKLKPGESLDGWVVESIETRRVVLRFESESFEITSGPSGKPGLVIQPVASAPAPVRMAQASAESGIRLRRRASATLATPPPIHDPKLTPRLYRPPPK